MKPDLTPATRISKAECDRALEMQLRGHGLTTARIHYYHPDFKDIITSKFYVWQEYDIFPKFPKLKKFLAWWQKELEGKIRIVQVMHSGMVGPARFERIDGEFQLN